jgi:hypothetical protein
MKRILGFMHKWVVIRSPNHNTTYDRRLRLRVADNFHLTIRPPRDRSHEARTERRYRSRSPRPTHNPAPPIPTARLDLNPHEQAGSTARPSPEEEESVVGWTAYYEERNRSETLPPRNPFAADSYRPNYESTGTTGTTGERTDCW